MANKISRAAFISCLILITSCGPMKSTDLDGRKDKVIYGVDNRKDLSEIDDSHWRELALSTAILVDERKISWNKKKQRYDLKGDAIGPSMGLCLDEPYYSQKRVGFCTGFLIGPEIMVTAGHCIRNEYNCETTYFVFDHALENPDDDLSTAKKSQVFRCKEVIHTEANALTGVDMAIVRLRKAVSDRSPLLMRTVGSISLDAELTVMGYPAGLPLKLAGGGLVRRNDDLNQFVTTLDTYAGNSGSPVLNSETRLVEGILVSGETDFTYDIENKCRRSKVCDEQECRGENVVRIEKVLEHITPADL